MRAFLAVAIAVIGLVALAAPAAAASHVVIYSHRGYSVKAPENTLPAIRRAAAAGAKHVELDVNLTKDDVPVLMHDKYLGRTTNGTGQVELRSYSYVRALDAGSWFSDAYAGTKVPSLVSALRLAQSLGLTVIIDLKGNITTAEARIVASKVRSLDMVGRVYPFSFSRDNVSRVNSAAPRFRIGLWERTPLTAQEASGLNFVAARADFASAEYITAMKAAGFTVYVWQTYDSAAWDQYHADGAQGWFSNDSHAASTWLQQH
jgi:glycerophosphoryl diester phosphodiesterase